MSSEEVRDISRAPACLCVFCGLPAAGKSTLARDVLRAAALAGWRAAVVPYDTLIPDRAFQAKDKAQGSVNTCVYKCNQRLFTRDTSNIQGSRAS